MNIGDTTEHGKIIAIVPVERLFYLIEKDGHLTLMPVEEE
jgi:hypothetical protein